MGKKETEARDYIIINAKEQKDALNQLPENYRTSLIRAMRYDNQQNQQLQDAIKINKGTSKVIRQYLKKKLGKKSKEITIEDRKKALNDFYGTEEVDFKQYFFGDKKEKVSKDSELFGNENKILENLKKNHLTIKENSEYMGYKGKTITFELPNEGKFKGFKFQYFVSNDRIYKGDFDKNDNLQNNSYSIKEIADLLYAMNRYMSELGIETDGNMDYDNYLKSWETDLFNCKVGELLKNILNLDKRYLLKDRNFNGKKNSIAVWGCYGDFCYFNHIDNDRDYGYILLNIS